MDNKLCCTFGEYSVIYDLESKSFDVYAKNNKKCIADAHIESVFYQGEEIKFDDFIKEGHTQDIGETSYMTINYSRNSDFVPTYSLKFEISTDGLCVRFISNPECVANICGSIQWGNDVINNSFPMSSYENSTIVRTALGPASSKKDNMLFDRLTDSAISVTGGKSFRMKYNWEKSSYEFSLMTGIKAGERKFFVSCLENIMADEYKIKYVPINKKSTFKKPPAGWMTWYSVGFDACEKNVLENVEWQNRHLKDFGADAVWIDWEWYHKDYAGVRDDGVDTFNPDPKKYPNGLKYIADKIKENGFKPALWVGYTNDGSQNEYTKENPEIIICDNLDWCGKYFYDFTHPKYLNEFLPKALKQVQTWGYEAIKYDTIWEGLTANEKNRMKAYNPSKTSKEAYRDMMKKTRECIGKNVYILACGPSKACITWAADLFEAARVGLDIFEWDEFIEQGLLATLKYYPLHNVVFYNDPDNVILSEKYNTYNQAKSRICFVSFLGLPMTFGDIFSELPEERIDLIKRCLPVMDIHPMNIKSSVNDKRMLTINLNIEKPYESYNVINVMNLLNEKRTQEIRLSEELYLEDGDYHIYDFMKKEYLGCSDNKMILELEPYESKVVAIRKKLNHPQIISTSRHVTQGAAEIDNIMWNEQKCLLTINTKLVKDDKYAITICIPNGYLPNDEKIKQVSEDIYIYEILPEKTQDYEIKLSFRR